jgi:hypothetical protein
MADGTMVTAANRREAGLAARFTPSLGSGVLIAVTLGNVASWLAPRPANQPTARYFGELCGAFSGSRRPMNAWIYMCGPPPMMSALADGFRVAGIPANQIRWEEFGSR